MTIRPSRRQLTLGAIVVVASLAVVETTVALVAPSLAPTDADWDAAAAAVRAGFRPGDLIVAAPAWADPILRVHLGDLDPARGGGPNRRRLLRARLGGEPAGRARARGRRGDRDRRARRTLRRAPFRLLERPAEAVGYDFVAHGADARVTRRDLRGGLAACVPSGDRVNCGGGSIMFHRQVVEVDQKLREALLTEPLANAAVIVD